ncbi:MAG: TetR/AcrR family transcriptional regulator [Anaerolineales bacterium]|nr:TetR/AcrR family transcriptional regulator [Anaerolineales bacterium]
MSDKKEDRRTEILMAALVAFAEKGYDKTSMDDIVRVSGLSKGTLYWYFKNKEALFLGIMDMIFNQFMSIIDAFQASLSDHSAADMLRMLIQQAAEFFATDEKLVGLISDMFLQATQNPAKLQALAEFYERYISGLQTIIQYGIDRGEFRSVDAHALAVAISASFDGVGLQLIIKPQMDTVAVLSTMIETIIQGLQHGDHD